MWRLWCYALGKKEGRDRKDSDNIARIRTAILLTYLVTNCFIVAGVIRHWNPLPESPKTCYNQRV